MKNDFDLVQKPYETKCLLYCISNLTESKVDIIQNFLKNEGGPHKITDFNKFFDTYKIKYNVYTKSQWKKMCNSKEIILIENKCNFWESILINCENGLKKHSTFVGFCVYSLFYTLKEILIFKTRQSIIRHAVIGRYENKTWYVYYDPNGKENMENTLNQHSDHIIEYCIEIYYANV